MLAPVQAAAVFCTQGEDSSERNECMWHAAQTGHVCDLPAAVDAVPDRVLNDMMRVAAWNGHEAVVEALLNRLTCVSRMQQLSTCALPVAAAHGQVAVAQVLLAAKAAADACAPLHVQRPRRTLSAMILAAEHGHTDMVRRLIETKAPLDQCGRWYYDETALLTAVRHNHVQIVQVLLEAQADANYGKPYDGWTPLGFAVMNGSVRSAALLLDAKADVHLRVARYHGSPLRLASRTGQGAIVQLLVQANATL